VPAPIDTSDMARRDRAELWQNAVCDQFVPMDVIPMDGLLRGRISGGSVGDLQLRRIAASPHRFERSTRLIRRSDEEYYKLIVGVGGEALLVQDGREVVVRSGDLAFYDSTRPYTFVMNEMYDVVVCMVPKRLLSNPAQQLRDTTATRIDVTTGSPALIAPFLSGLFSRLGEFVAGETDALVHSMAGLVDAVVRRQAAPGDLVGSPHLLRALRVIDEQISDPALCPDSVAAAIAISASYLHKLFALQQLSVASYIRELRLQGCSRDLRSPLFDHLPVSGVGSRWGLVDPSQLSRLFKARFGVSPVEHRRAAMERRVSDVPGDSSSDRDALDHTAGGLVQRPMT
jgi:AraC-like DNA-binding protein